MGYPKRRLFRSIPKNNFYRGSYDEPYYEEDDEEASRYDNFYSPTVYCSEDGYQEVVTGVLDHHGNPIVAYEEEEPIGFLHSVFPSSDTYDPG